MHILCCSYGCNLQLIVHVLWETHAYNPMVMVHVLLWEANCYDAAFLGHVLWETNTTNTYSSCIYCGKLLPIIQHFWCVCSGRLRLIKQHSGNMYDNGFMPMTQFSHCIYSWCLLYVTKHLWCFYSEADTHLYCKYYVVGCCVQPNGSVRSKKGKCGLRKEIDKRQQTVSGGYCDLP